MKEVATSCIDTEADGDAAMNRSTLFSMQNIWLEVKRTFGSSWHETLAHQNNSKPGNESMLVEN
jgi:hypothetical protein